MRKGAERREKRQKGAELLEEEDKEHRHLPLLVVQLPQGTEFLTRFCSKALQHSSWLGKGSGLKETPDSEVLR